MRESQSPSSKETGNVSGGVRDTATSATFGPGSLPGIPGEVRASLLLWLTAVGAGVVEVIIRVIYSLPVETDVVSGVFIRAIIYAVVVYIIFQMKAGKRWARATLALLLGVIGTLSLVIDPISWLAAGNSLRDVFNKADLLFVFVAPIRAVHLAAVIAALAFMFSPAANGYFRSPGRGAK